MEMMSKTAATAAVRRRWLEKALRALREGSYAELRKVRCGVEEGRLVLQGVVSSFYLKQVAHALVRRSSGEGCAIDNRLEVNFPQSDGLR